MLTGPLRGFRVFIGIITKGVHRDVEKRKEGYDIILGFRLPGGRKISVPLGG